MNKGPHYHQQKEPRQCKSEIEGIYSSKPGNWTSQHLYLKINTRCHASQFREST